MFLNMNEKLDRKTNDDGRRIGVNCPYCNVAMLHGYLNCEQTIWSERKHKISFLPNGVEKYTLRLVKPWWSPHHVESYCCPKCKKIIIDASYYENNLG